MYGVQGKYGKCSEQGKNQNKYITAKIASEAWMKHFRKLYTAQTIEDGNKKEEDVESRSTLDPREPGNGEKIYLKAEKQKDAWSR